MDLVIKNGTLVTASDVYRADVGIAGEKVVSIAQELIGQQILDATDRLVFPGFVDPHVHLQMPLGDIVTADDFLTGTIAAACGGTTTIIDFVEAMPGDSLISAVGQRRAEAEPNVAIDYSLHLTANCAGPAFLKEIRELAPEGFTSIKLYTTYPDLRVEDGEMLEILSLARECGLLPLVHAENDAIVHRLSNSLVSAGHTSPRYHPRSRPCLAEVESIQRLLALAKLVDAPLYFVHVSCWESLSAIERARAAGQTVFVEVTPHHLLLDEKAYDQAGMEGARFCCAPPLRTQDDRGRLWMGLARGAIQVVATDHCSWSFALRQQRGRMDFTGIPNGLAGIETRIPLIYEEGVNAGRLSLNQFVDVCATTPAKLTGLYPLKGSIVVGGDADLVIFDPQRTVTLSHSILHHNVDDCPFEGWSVRGYPEVVLSRGKVVARNGEFVGEVGAGRFIRRRRFEG